MGQKTHPIGFRLGIIKSWNSRWFAADRKFSDLIYEDMMVKRYISKRLDNAGIASVCISRAPKKVTIDIHTSRPGIVIGRKGAEVDKLREELQLLTKKDILLNIVEVRKPELDAKLVADSIARQLVGRVSFRRAMKKSIAATMKMGAVGIKVQCAGRLGGAEIAREEKYKEGRVPLHTLRADIDYATSTAHTTYGCIGVKVWICRGEILESGIFYKDEETHKKPEQEVPTAGRSKREHASEKRRKRPRGRIRRKTHTGFDRNAQQHKGRHPETVSESKAVDKSSEDKDKKHFTPPRAKHTQKVSKDTHKRKTTTAAKTQKRKSKETDQSGKQKPKGKIRTKGGKSKMTNPDSKGKASS